ncbi:alpha/beta fold hydrolase [Cryptosporangium phraense]|uniref:Alpha/beta fold hydrolase n=1 Tax=Cryptosporangium phraense TaxID=2593070 RepID=A0A545AMI9_9ACTN|nr:alpha/beta hydrolase [Cryptosporangium phraense]TQS42522.1 alpha/beta fold hydrolase [Cryptosporangium phraense]
MLLHVERTGDPAAPALVFLHGIATAGWMWWRQLPAFPDRYCLVVDLPGHGLSNGVPWVSLSDTAARVADVIRSTAGRAAVVGLSLGGYVALELPSDVVERAVVSGVTAEPWPHRWFLRAGVRLTTAQLRSARLVDAQARRLGLPEDARAAHAEAIRALRPGTYLRAAQEVSRYRPSAGRRPSAGAPPTAAPAPTLVLAGGRESPIIRRSVTQIPGATGRIVPGVGHAWNVEAPDRFNATIRDWLRSPPRSPR